MKDVHDPPEYAAHVYIGYDPEDEQYVAHWIDSTGGRSSETLGYGQREDDAITFKFNYPDAPFRTTFKRRPDGTWNVLMRTKDGPEAWSTFAEYDVKPRPDS